MAFSDSALCVGVSNPDLPITGQPKMEDVWNEHGFVETINFAAREVQNIWHVFPGASTADIKKHIQKCLNGQKPQNYEMIIFMSLLNDSEGAKKGNT